MIDRWRLVFRVLVSACLIASLASCGAPRTHRRYVRIMLTAASDLNPDGDGRPSPVMVRIYELEEAGDFRQAGFFDLYDHDKSVLGNGALARMVLAVRPGERLSLRHEVDPRSRHLAVLVAYRNIYRAQWRAVVDLPDTGDSAWSLTLNADSLQVAASGGTGTKRETSTPVGVVKSVAPQWDKLAKEGNASGDNSRGGNPDVNNPDRNSPASNPDGNNRKWDKQKGASPQEGSYVLEQ